MNIAKDIKRWLVGICDAWADEMRSTFKDEGVLIFFVLVPLLYPLLYSWIYTNEVVREVPVAVVDMSHSEASREFVRRMDASPDVRVAYHCNNLAEAKDLVGRQEAFGVVYFPVDFQTAVARMQQSRVSVFCDMGFMLYYKAIYQSATAVAGDMNAAIQIERAGNWTAREDEITTKPLDFDEVQIFNSTGGYGNFIIPGVLMLIIQQTVACSSVVMMLGRALCYFMIYAVVSAYVALVVPRMFSFTSLLHPADTFWFMLPFVLSSIFFAMTLSCAVRYRENVILLVVFTSVPLLFLSGVSWPQSAVPEFWQWVSALFPSTFGVRGFVRMNTMGALLGDVKVEYVALWVQTLAYFVAACLAYRWRANKIIKN